MLIIGRDVVLALGIGSAARHGYELSVIYLGKTATSVLMVGLGDDDAGAAAARAGRRCSSGPGWGFRWPRAASI